MVVAVIMIMIVAVTVVMSGGVPSMTVSLSVVIDRLHLMTSETLDRPVWF
jgi:hypothetical protein